MKYAAKRKNVFKMILAAKNKIRVILNKKQKRDRLKFTVESIENMFLNVRT